MKFSKLSSGYLLFTTNLPFPTLKYKQDWLTPRKMSPYSELFWCVFFRIWTEYGEIRSISPYSVQMRENADQNNSEYRHFSHSAWLTYGVCSDGKAKNLKCIYRLMFQDKIKDLSNFSDIYTRINKLPQICSRWSCKK